MVTFIDPTTPFVSCSIIHEAEQLIDRLFFLFKYSPPSSYSSYTHTERLRQASMRSQATQTEGFYNSTTSLSYPLSISADSVLTIFIVSTQSHYLFNNLIIFYCSNFQFHQPFLGQRVPSTVTCRRALNLQNQRFV